MAEQNGAARPFDNDWYVNDYYPQQLEHGLKYQDWVGDVLWGRGIVLSQYVTAEFQRRRGEGRAGIEIKFNRRHGETGNLWIETSERATLPPENGQATYIDSGIYRQDNSWLFVTGTYKVVFIFGINILRRLHRSGNPRFRSRLNSYQTGYGFLLYPKDQTAFATDIIDTRDAKNPVVLYSKAEEEAEQGAHLVQAFEDFQTGQTAMFPPPSLLEKEDLGKGKAIR